MDQNYFDLLGLPAKFAIDANALDRAYRELQHRVHPDRFVGAPDAQQRVALQWATQANEAYRTLKSPLARARYLCELEGVDLQTESNTAMPPQFLMQQMAWREALDDARAERSEASLDRIERDVRATREATLRDIEIALDAGSPTTAAPLVRQLMFVERFVEEVGEAFAELETE